MKKYIECEAAYRFAQDQLKKETGAYSKGWNNAMNVMKGALHNNDAIPAADVVAREFYDRLLAENDELRKERPVVRCGECEYRKDARVNEKGFLICPASGMEITDNDYCSYGVSKDGDGE